MCACEQTGSGQFTPYDTYIYTHQGQFQYDDSNWVPRYEGLLNDLHALHTEIKNDFSFIK